jgi:hypothetical protein
MAKMTAAHLAEQLRRAGFVVMQRPALEAHTSAQHGPAGGPARDPGRLRSVRRASPAQRPGATRGGHDRLDATAHTALARPISRRFSRKLADGNTARVRECGHERAQRFSPSLGAAIGGRRLRYRAQRRDVGEVD